MFKSSYGVFGHNLCIIELGLGKMGQNRLNSGQNNMDVNPVRFRVVSVRFSHQMREMRAVTSNSRILGIFPDFDFCQEILDHIGGFFIPEKQAKNPALG